MILHCFKFQHWNINASHFIRTRVIYGRSKRISIERVRATLSMHVVNLFSFLTCCLLTGAINETEALNY